MLQKAAISFTMSVCLSAWQTSASTGQVFVTFDVRAFYQNLLENQVLLKSDKNTGHLSEDLSIFATVTLLIHPG